MIMKNAARTCALLLVTAAVLVGCDNPVGGPVDDHLEPVGAVITDLEGNLIAETHDTGAAAHWDFESGDALVLAAGEDVELRVLFVDEDGDTFFADDVEGYQLGWLIGDESVAEIHSHGDHIDMEALSAGETTVIFRFWHGVFPTSGHTDFDAPPLPVNVSAG